MNDDDDDDELKKEHIQTSWYELEHDGRVIS